jgi:hypothetical protein
MLTLDGSNDAVFCSEVAVGGKYEIQFWSQKPQIIEPECRIFGSETRTVRQILLQGAIGCIKLLAVQF